VAKRDELIWVAGSLLERATRVLAQAEGALRESDDAPE
jgi:hypothetical protein